MSVARDHKLNLTKLDVNELYALRREIDEELQKHEADLRMLVLPSGFIYVGAFHRSIEYSTLNNVVNVRTFDTNRGHDILAEEGPAAGCTLDPCPEIECHNLVVNHTLRCNLSKWGNYLEHTNTNKFNPVD